MRLRELRMKEVINTCTCSSLGCVLDIDFNPCTGCILALIVPGPGKCFSFLGRDTEYVIPWECICQIGADIILVDVDLDKCKKSSSNNFS